MKNIKHLTRLIICEHTEAVMKTVEYHPENNHALYEIMIEECANIITNKFIDGELTPMEYNDLRNETATMLWSIFKPHIENE